MSSLTVLLAEDEPVISLDIRQLLEKKGLMVVQVTDFRSITEACEQLQPCLVILNYKQWENGDGMAFVRMLHQRFGLSVLLITGALTQDIEAARGLDSKLEVLFKPFTRAQLHACVHRCLS